jgi:hypothetical protein
MVALLGGCGSGGGALGFETQGFPGIFVLAKGTPMVTNSTIE